MNDMTPEDTAVLNGRRRQRMADTVTEMNVVKHAFKAGIAAQAGTEW